MPIFEYKCNACAKEFEVLQLAGREEGVKCPDCGCADVKKLISAPFLPSSVGRPANDEIGRCCNSSPEENGCAAGSCCGRGLQ